MRTEPAPVRVMLDSMVPDVLAGDEKLTFGMRDLVAEGRLEILITHVQVDELVTTPDLERRRQLLNPLFFVGARSVETSGVVLGSEPDPGRPAKRQRFGGSRLGYARFGDDRTNADLTALMAKGVRHVEDALIIVSARDYGAILVSDERRAPSWPALVTGLKVHSSAVFRELVMEMLAEKPEA